MKTPSKIRLFAASLLAASGSLWTASAINVTYQVDMSIQTAIGNFYPGSDTVFVSGNLSNPDWLQTSTDGSTNYVLTQSAGNPDVYEGTFAIDVAVNDWENHKFVINPYGDFFSTLRWEESIGNRFFQVPATDTNLPVVFFDDVNTLPSTRDVTFQVDMSILMATTNALGDLNFVPSTDFVNVAGPWNSWSETADTLTQNSTNAGLYEGTFTVTGLTSNTMPYKFIASTFANGVVWEDDGVGPEGAQNREMVLAATNQSLPVVCFNNVCTLPISVPVTFQVNMAAQVAYGNFVDGVNTVTAAGSFNSWDAVSFILTNDPGEPYVYKGTTDVVAGEGALVSYKHVIDGATWEDSIGDRGFNLATNSQTLATVFFDDVDDLGPVSTVPADGNQVDVSWNPGALVGLQQSTDLTSAWADVPATTGESNATVTITTDETYFRLIGPVSP